MSIFIFPKVRCKMEKTNSKSYLWLLWSAHCSSDGWRMHTLLRPKNMLQCSGLSATDGLWAQTPFLSFPSNHKFLKLLTSSLIWKESGCCKHPPAAATKKANHIFPPKKAEIVFYLAVSPWRIQTRATSKGTWPPWDLFTSFLCNSEDSEVSQKVPAKPRSCLLPG